MFFHLWNLHLFLSTHTSGEHGRGEATRVDVVAKVSIGDEFVGNWVVKSYLGPGCEKRAEDEITRLKSLIEKRKTGGMETKEERVLRKAGEIRKAMIQAGLVISPEPDRPFEDLPPERQGRWIKVARTYCEWF